MSLTQLMSLSDASPTALVLLSQILSTSNDFAQQPPLSVVVAGARGLVVVGQIEVAKEAVKLKALELSGEALGNLALRRRVEVYRLDDAQLERATQAPTCLLADVALL